MLWYILQETIILQFTWLMTYLIIFVVHFNNVKFLITFYIFK